MSVIAIVIDERLDAKKLMTLHRALNFSLQSIKSKSEAELPVIKIEIF